MKSTLTLGLIGSLVTLSLLFEMMRRKRLREKYAVFWALVALVTLTIAAFPGLLTAAADALGVTVPSNLLFFGASMLLLVVSVQHSSELGRLEERTRTLAEEVGLLQMEVVALRTQGTVSSSPNSQRDVSLDLVERPMSAQLDMSHRLRAGRRA
jgi:hypothetical protein